MFVPTILQVLLLPLAGVALFRIWRYVSSTGKGVALVVTAGFLIRAFFGQLLFWLSYLPLRFPPGTEDNNGMWFYAWDGRAYFLSAVQASSGGPLAILHYPSAAAAAFYVKILALLVTLFGSVASVSLLFNLFAYLGTCAAMVSLFPRDSRTTTFALAAMSFYPSVILWSLQPLKDTFFLALVAAFIALAFAWQQVWKPSDERRRRVLRAAAIFIGVVVLIYGIAGIRWYFAAVFLVGLVPFFALSSIRARSWMSAIASVLLFAASVWAFYVGGGDYVPPALLALVQSEKPAAAATQLPKTLIAGVVDIRDGFRRTPGNTDIVAAKTAAPPPPAAAKPNPPEPVQKVAAAKPKKVTTPAKVATAKVAPPPVQPAPAADTAPPATPAVTASTETAATDTASTDTATAPKKEKPATETAESAPLVATTTTAEAPATTTEAQPPAAQVAEVKPAPPPAPAPVKKKARPIKKATPPPAPTPVVTPAP